MVDALRISKVLSDPIRYQIMLMLIHQSEAKSLPCCTTTEGVCNCEIMAQFGMIQSRVSYHMKELAEAELVHEVPDGRWKFYLPNKETLKQYIKQLEVDFQLQNDS